MPSEAAERLPCRHCGEPTRQRASGIPYCSMDCIGGRRRERRTITYQCPHPGCGWEYEYDPEIKLQIVQFKVESEKHKREHGGEPRWSE